MKSKLLLSVLLVGGLHNAWGGPNNYPQSNNTKFNFIGSAGIGITAGLGTTAAMYATNKFIANNRPDLVGTSLILGAGLLAGLSWHHCDSLVQNIPSQDTAIKGLVTFAGAGLGFHTINVLNTIVSQKLGASGSYLLNTFNQSKNLSLACAAILGAFIGYNKITSQSLYQESLLYPVSSQQQQAQNSSNKILSYN